MPDVINDVLLFIDKGIIDNIWYSESLLTQNITIAGAFIEELDLQRQINETETTDTEV